jgi:large subunit ribosomal protein L4
VTESTLTVVDDLTVEGFQTKRVVAILAALGLSEGSTLIVIEDANPTVEASARNLPGVSVIRAEGVNVYDLLRHQNLLITKAAIEAIEARLGKEGGAS